MLFCLKLRARDWKSFFSLMASDLIQEFAFRQISKAVMATTNSITSSLIAESSDAPNTSASNEDSIFGIMRRQWGKVQDALQGITAPHKRRSMYDELPEHFWPQENIEMSSIPKVGNIRGHYFVYCQLPSATWCDFCGKFIWGLRKTCMRCQREYIYFLLLLLFTFCKCFLFFSLVGIHFIIFWRQGFISVLDELSRLASLVSYILARFRLKHEK